MKRSWTKRINIFLFIATFALKSITDAVYVAHDRSSIFVSMKYLTMGCGIALAAIILSQSNNRPRIWQKDFLKLFSVVIVFGIITLIAQVISSTGNNAVYEELVKLALGSIYAYFIINTMDSSDFNLCMKFILLFGIIGYILEIGTGTFNLSSLSQIDFLNSYSPFESSYAAGTAVTTATYFVYNHKERKYTVLSLLFVFFTFKRASILFLAFLFIVSILADKDRKIKRVWIVLIIVFFIFCTYAYMYLLKPDNSALFNAIFGSSANEFTTGRSIRYQYLIQNEFVSSGFGSTTAAIGRNMEMDLIKISMELSIVGLVYFIGVYISITHRNLFCVLLMFYNLFNMLTSQSLNGNFAWTLKFLIIAYIIYGNQPQRGKRVIKRINIF